MKLVLVTCTNSPLHVRYKKYSLIISVKIMHNNIMLNVNLGYDSCISPTQEGRKIMLIHNASAVGTHDEQMPLFIHFKIGDKSTLLPVAKTKRHRRGLSTLECLMLLRGLRIAIPLVSCQGVWECHILPFKGFWRNVVLPEKTKIVHFVHVARASRMMDISCCQPFVTRTTLPTSTDEYYKY